MDDMNMKQRQSEDDRFEDGYLQGMLQGRRDGRADGLNEGRKEGIKLGKGDVLLLQVDKRFGFVPLWVRTLLATADERQIEEWLVAMLSATSFDEVFGPPHESF